MTRMSVASLSGAGPKRFVLPAVALAVATCCTPAPSQSATADWVSLATAPRTSPVDGDGLHREWTGADGQPVSLTVLAPRVAGRPTITLRPADGDNAPAITAALAKLRASGGGTLRLAPGSYPIAGGPPALPLDRLTDVLVDGTGAQLVFANWGDGILISNAARLAIRGLSVGYARPPVVAAQVRGGALAFAGPTPPPGAPVFQVTGTGPGGARMLLGRQGRALQAGGALGGNALGGFAPGAPVRVKLSYYKGGAIRIFDPDDKPVSHDITLDGVTVRDSAGAGVVVDLMGRGLAVIGSQFGTDGGAGIAYDALHVTAATGDILVEHNQFAGSGDDAINLASPIFDAQMGPGGRTALIGGNTAHIYPGARLALFDAGLQLVGTAQIAGRSPRDGQGRMPTEFTAPVSTSGVVRYARNMDLLGQRYAIVDNQVADCVCHGVLAQNPDGLIRDNSFSGLRYNAIRLLTSAMWKEGAGALNVVVADNRVQGTGADERGGMVWAAITVFGELAGNGAGGQAPIAPTPLNARLLIRDNQIAEVGQGCISVSSATDVTLDGNRCTGFDRRAARTPMLMERASMAAGLARLPAKSAYLARGDGVWIDPTTTSAVTRDGAAGG